MEHAFYTLDGPLKTSIYIIAAAPATMCQYRWHKLIANRDATAKEIGVFAKSALICESIRLYAGNSLSEEEGDYFLSLNAYKRKIVYIRG